MTAETLAGQLRFLPVVQLFNHFFFGRNMDRKTVVAAADLFVLFDREFRRRKPRECGACELQLPYPVKSAGGADWQMVPPRDCGRGCMSVFEELVNEFQRLYALKPATG